MKKSRTFACVLYPEDEEQMKILEYIKINFEYAYILHNEDVWEEDTEEHKVGELKKEHYHVLVYFKNARSIDSVKKELNIQHLETCNFYAYTRYLIHKDNPRKHQYSKEEIKTNIDTRIYNALKRDYNSQEQDTRILLDFIFSIRQQSFVTYKQLIEYAIENDCLLELKRNINFYRPLIDDNGFRRY